jgi:hypothetical protein
MFHIERRFGHSRWRDGEKDLQRPYVREVPTTLFKRTQKTRDRSFNRYKFVR